MSNNLSVNEVKAILEKRDFDELIGLNEDVSLECKGSPYQLEAEYQKRELAKDVCSLANAEGGLILIGAQTERDKRHAVEKVTKISPFEASRVNVRQYQDVLSEWIYPTLQGIEVRWFASLADRNRGMAAIMVSRQSPTRSPFILAKSVDENGKQVGMLFGYFERSKDRVLPMRAQELQSRLRDGIRFDSIHQRFEGIGEELRDLRESLQRAQGEAITPVPSPDDKNQLDLRIGLALSELGREPTMPMYILAASPRHSVNFHTLFSARDAELVRLLEQPPMLRRSGFGLEAGDHAHIVRGQYRKAVIREYKILALWRDGTLVFVGPGDGDFLSWGRASDKGPLRINQLALVESVFLFAELSRQVFAHASPRPSEIEFHLELRNMTVGSQPANIVPGPLGSFDYQFGTVLRPAPDSGHRFSSCCNWGELERHPGDAAFRLVCQVYEWFGIEHDRIPYIESLDGRMVISPDRIKEAGR